MLVARFCVYLGYVPRREQGMRGATGVGRTFTRQNFLRAGGAAFLVTASATGCDALSTEPAQNGRGEQNGVAGRKGKEAPELAGRVRAGELPPVEERMPQNPLVVEPVERVGGYGGEWRTGLIGEANPTAWLNYTIGYEYLVRWKPNTKEFSAEQVVPNVAEDFEFNEEGTEYTFRLREGMKWSDGEPFTADDILFWYEDVFMNEELTPAKTSWLVAGGEPVVVEKTDDYTVVFRFASPSGLFLQQLAKGGDMITTSPRHYLERFHKKYNPDVEQLAEEEGAADWIELFQNKGGALDTIWQNPELPTPHAWKLTVAAGEDVGRVVAERNPYYWKTDPEGSQLPYIDRVTYSVVQEDDVLVLKALNGEIDFHFPNISSLNNKPVFAKNMERGDYHFVDVSSSNMNTQIIALNLTHEDPVKREVFNSKDFRIGLSHAINRREIIDVIYQQQGQPFQAAPRPESSFYDEEMAKQYTEYDVDLANEHLDRADYTERGNGDVRLGPDGEPISFQVEAITAHGESIDALELIKGYWKEVGVDMRVKPVDQSLFVERVAGNQPDATVWFGSGGLDVLLNPSWYFPSSPASHYAVPWAQWYASKGESGQEQPEAARRQMEIYDRLMGTIAPDEQTALMSEILRIAKQEFYAIGVNL
jgi:peptide/nickel transport system substrate-binding protein